MRQRRIYRRGIPRSLKLKWGVFIAIIFAFAGVSYAAHTNVLFGDFTFNTSGMSFIFDNDEDVSVQIRDGEGGKIKDLVCKASYDDKRLIIKDIGPIDLNDFTDGNANILIQYAIKADDKENGIILPAAVDEKSENGYELGAVELELLTDTPVWSLENGGKSWGTKSDGINGTPSIVYQFLPKTLGEFQVFNELQPRLKDGYMTGTLLLKQEKKLKLFGDNEIGLSSLSLSSDVTDEIQNDSLLEIRGTYGFAIPLCLDQFNVKQ